MSENREAGILANLHALLDAVVEEMQGNPGFALKVEASLSKLGGGVRQAEAAPAQAAEAKEAGKPPRLLDHVTFDPLECHIEASLISGREQEARAFLGKLDRVQLDEVVKVQRLPGAKTLQKTIFEADAAAAVDAIVGSAAERVRSRLSAAR